ncbi:MAG TPA: T9SS C-terminal target domain-containing protein [Bacteroidota bacterium]|nr:T9SS C-terminal target domain-containing protein [Bacteroidota bacterium]
MMKRLFSILALVTIFFVESYAAEAVLGPGRNSGRTTYHQTWNRTLSADTLYFLTGLYFVDSTYSITIPAGTVIVGDTAATLIIRPGAKIFATGTASNPVVFTSERPGGQRDRGNWGGVIILGSAPTNQVNPQIEGGIIPGAYGGSNAADNSGVFQYCRIEFAGYRFQLDNEINGLTMGGVGSGTAIDHVQVSYSFDDSYEWFGGTVTPHHLVAYSGQDDDFDTDFGFSGKVQFGFSLRNPDVSETASNQQSNGFESDNEGTASYNPPRTSALFSNMTLIGYKRVDTVAARTGRNFEYVAVLRRGTKESIYNSVICGFPGGISMRDVQTWSNPREDTLQIRNTSLGSVGPLANFNVSGLSAGETADSVKAWFNTAGWSNLGGADVGTGRSTSALGFTDMNDLIDPNPVPGSGSELIGSASFTNPRLSAGFFDMTANYRGAFDPSKTLDQQWTAGWTNFNPQFSSIWVEAGWNMVAVPSMVPNTAATAVFPGKSGSAFSYNTGTSNYDVVNNVVPGQGMWVKYPTRRIVPFSGRTINGTITIPVAAAGWVLVGGQSRVVNYISASGSGAITGGQFKWDPVAQNYVPANLTSTGTADLLPGEAAWVKVTGPCTLTLNQ